MMGYEGNEGIIPRLCSALFERIASKTSQSWQAKVEVSYMEIYNERVHDLLDPMASTSNKHGLKVREHNVLGPYVDGLSQLAVISSQAIKELITEGNKSRTVASTNMNNESSRYLITLNTLWTSSSECILFQVSCSVFHRFDSDFDGFAIRCQWRES